MKPLAPSYGRLKLLGPPVHRLRGKRNRLVVLCRCACGKEKEVEVDHLRSGDTVSCGCHKAEQAREHVRPEANIRHGHTVGKTRSPEFSTWCGIRNRCQRSSSQHYPRYGGRGIKVCDRWEAFEAFLEDMGPRPGPEYTVERIDNNGHYEPGNCVWATRKEQARNTRRTRRMRFQGKITSFSAVCEALSLPYDATLKRLKYWGIVVLLG